MAEAEAALVVAAVEEVVVEVSEAAAEEALEV